MSDRAIICKIEYPPPYTEKDKIEILKEHPGIHIQECHDEVEYIVDSTLLTGYEIVEQY